MDREIEDLVEQHLSIWNTTDQADRQRRIPDVYADTVRVGEADAVYTGPQGVDEAIADLQAAVPGQRLWRTEPISRAQEMLTYRWSLGDPVAGLAVASGRDVLLIDEGVITTVYVVVDPAV